MVFQMMSLDKEAPNHEAPLDQAILNQWLP